MKFRTYELRHLSNISCATRTYILDNLPKHEYVVFFLHFFSLFKDTIKFMKEAIMNYSFHRIDQLVFVCAHAYENWKNITSLVTATLRSERKNAENRLKTIIIKGNFNMLRVAALFSSKNFSLILAIKFTA